MPRRSTTLDNNSPWEKHMRIKVASRSPQRPFRAASINDSTSFEVRCSRSRGRRVGPEVPTFRFTPSGEAFGMAGTHSVPRDYHPALFAEGAFGEMFDPVRTPSDAQSRSTNRNRTDLATQHGPINQGSHGRPRRVKTAHVRAIAACVAGWLKPGLFAYKMPQRPYPANAVSSERRGVPKWIYITGTATQVGSLVYWRRWRPRTSRFDQGRVLRQSFRERRMGICAYCDADRKLTREELWPKFLTARTPDYRTQVDHTHPQKPLTEVQVIRDVCADCNNRVLGSLDGYAAKLADRYLCALLEKPVESHFDCESDLLLRWLLKVLFNSARIGGEQIDIFRDLRPYILGREDHPQHRINLVVGLIEPATDMASGEMIYQTHQGIAVLAPAAGVSLFRAVFLNSFVFCVMVWRPDSARPIRRRFLRRMKDFRLAEIPIPRCSIILRGSCMNALTPKNALATRTFSFGQMKN
jgi:hypothetical protein